MNLKRPSGLVLAACLLAIPLTGVTQHWAKDMQDQPSMKPQDSVIETNQATVPVGGKDEYPPPKDIIELVQARLTAGQSLVNPVPK